MKNTIRTLSLGFLLFALCGKKSYSQPISNHIFGVNAWMSDTIGDPNNCQDPPCIRYGKIHKNWGKVKDSYAKIVRYGGIAPDKNIPTKYQYLRMVDSIQAKGMEPLIQVPFCDYRYTAQQAADIVHYINIVKGRNVKYWIIANEPNLGYGYTTASQIAAYFKPFASAMKAVDPTILIVGPETASFKQGMTDDLTTPGGPDDITGKDAAGRYYLDVFTFHTYPLGNGTQTRATGLTKLTAPGSYQDDIDYLNNRLAACDTYHHRTGAASLKTAITEANVDYKNSPSDDLYGIGANSFFGGQFVAEMYGIGMKKKVDFINLWSVIEGGQQIADNCGYIDPNTGNKKPLYYHFQLMAENFKGNSVNCTDNQANVKAFACQDAQKITVMIMNQELTGSYAYTLRLNNGAVVGAGALKLNANANVAKEYSSTLSNQSTVLLTFDANGTLVKKCEYSLAVHAIANMAPTCTTYSQAHTIDLAITSPAVLPGSAVAGSTVSVNATIANSGDTAAASSNVGYYLSADSNLDASDTYLSSSTGATLNAGGNAQKSKTLTVPANTVPGTYYILYVADYSHLVAESDENNNVNNRPLTVTAPPVPHTVDLLITAPSVSPGSVAVGNTVSVNATVFNAGDTAASSSKIGYYLSADTSFSASDVYLSNSAGSTLNAATGALKNATLTIPANTLPGSYYILYFADYQSLVTESNENNNVAHTALAVTAVPPAAAADLLITAPSLSPSTVLAGNAVSFSCTIFNAGNASSSSSNVGYYLSADTVFDGADLALSNSLGGNLNAGTGSQRSANAIVPAGTNAGNYYILFMADHSLQVNESNENNNLNHALLSVTVIAPPSTVDLQITAATVSPVNGMAGSTVTLNSTVFNAGNSVASASSVGYYLSADSLFDGADVLLSTNTGAALNAGASAQRNGTATIPAGTLPGNYYVLYVADPSALVNENDEANNLRHSLFSVPAAPSGISEQTGNFNLSVYPNPSRRKFTVELGKSGSGEDNYYVEVVNLLGEIVYHKDLLFKGGREELELPEEVATGTYILRVKMESGFVSKKIMIND